MSWRVNWRGLLLFCGALLMALGVGTYLMKTERVAGQVMISSQSVNRAALVAPTPALSSVQPDRPIRPIEPVRPGRPIRPINPAPAPPPPPSPPAESAGPDDQKSAVP
ncbi:MAG: hypothetical protein ACKOB4_15300, partial [Acidobacteriota bacterium]